MNKTVAAAAALLISSTFAVSANAGVTLAPNAVVANSFGANPFGGFPQENMFNQSNVTPYVAGVTDFAAYVAGNPMAGCNNCSGHYFGSNGSQTGNIDFDFGTTTRVLQLGLFNGSYRGITSLDVYTSDVSDFVTSTFVGNFSPTITADDNQDVGIQVFDLVDSNARYVRFSINSFANLDGCNCVGVSELVFDTAAVSGAVPEPATWAMMIGGFGLAGGALRRRKANVSVSFA